MSPATTRALRARFAEAPFPFLATNLRDDGGAPRLGASPVLLERAGTKVEVIGITTEATPHTTITANFAGIAAADGRHDRR